MAVPVPIALPAGSPIKLVEGLDFKLICLISFFHNCSVAGEPGKELKWHAASCQALLISFGDNAVRQRHLIVFTKYPAATPNSAVASAVDL
jgi:hypothetical protein